MTAKPLTIFQLAPDLDGMANQLEEGSFEEVLSGGVRDVIMAAVAANFASERSADNQPWPPRVDPTGTWPLLNKTGKLLAAATGQGEGSLTEAEDRELRVGADLVYAAAQHYGRQEINLPPRPFMGVGDEAQQVIAGLIEDRGAELIDQR